MDYLPLKICDSSIDAHLVKNKLERENIPCFLTNENITNLFPHYFGILGSGVQVLVHKDDYNKAKKLIAPKVNQIICPNCKSENISSELEKPKNKLLIGAIIILLAMPAGNLLNKYICRECKTAFKH